MAWENWPSQNTPMTAENLAQFTAANAPPSDQVLATASINTGIEDAGSIALAKTTRIMKVAADRACRVRFYSTAADRDADAARVVGTDADDDAGLITELVFIASKLSIRLSPQSVGSNWDTPRADVLYWRVRNDGANGVVTLTITNQRMES